MIIGTAGHIDHGKTTLIHALTGVDTDRLPEEKRRGITIELGFAPLTLDGVGVIGVVDVPGHEAFVRTMVAGAAGIDLALLVVAADEGVMPQTREHLAVLALLGVRLGVVALTKCDAVDPELIALAADDVRLALVGSTLEDAPIIPVSARSGHGLDELRTALATASRRIATRASDDRFRMPVDRIFTVKGTGTVVTGTVWSGTVATGDTVTIAPAGIAARVRSVESHGASTATALPGHRIALALVGVERDAVERGAAIVDAALWPATTRIRADVRLLPGAPNVTPRTRFRFHCGTAEVGARVVVRGGVTNAESRAGRIVLDAPIVARAGDRFVLRAGAMLTTVGGGVITDPFPPFRRSRPFTAADAETSQRLRWMLDEADHHGLAIAPLALRLGVRPSEVGKLTAALDAERIGEALHPKARLREAAAALTAWLSTFHQEHPLEPGVNAQRLREVLTLAPDVAAEVLRRAIAASRVVSRDGVISLPDFSVAPTGERATLAERLVDRLEAAGAEPPTVAELTAEHGAEALGLLKHLAREGRVVAVATDRYYGSWALQALRDRLQAGTGERRSYLPGELRELLGVSRKWAIPLLEYFDRAGVSRREGDGRTFRW
ncbi:MAG: selenocysteine-specific translation elongation factor [Gemmatimonadaceae bacterium]|nr:selenocysteine-specific translation elongation factor [Gemmatimonadaceae bacterium]